MNTADRSIALLDTALRRRFEFVEMMPDEKLLTGIFVEGVDISQLFTTINKRIEALYDRDHQIGHTYFLSLRAGPSLGKLAMEKLADIFRHAVLPLLQEYFYDDWEKINVVLNGNGFVTGDNPPTMRGHYQDEEKKIWRIASEEVFKKADKYQIIYQDNAEENQPKMTVTNKHFILREFESIGWRENGGQEVTVKKEDFNAIQAFILEQADKKAAR